MIPKDKFLEKVQEIANSKPSYELGQDGSDGTIDNNVWEPGVYGWEEV